MLKKCFTLDNNPYWFSKTNIPIRKIIENRMISDTAMIITAKINTTMIIILKWWLRYLFNRSLWLQLLLQWFNYSHYDDASSHIWHCQSTGSWEMKSVILEHMLQIKFASFSCEITLKWIAQIAPLTKSQHWFRKWLGVVRQQAIAQTKVEPDLCCC